MKKILASIIGLSLHIILFLSCKKDIDVVNPYLKPPTVHAGNSGNITLPVSFTNLTGTATSYNGKIIGYLWSLISGPYVPTIESSSSTTTRISNLLVAGTYKFQFAAIDSAGLTGVDTTSFTVLQNPIKTLIIQPTNNPTEGHIDSYYNSAGNDTEIPIGVWTIGGAQNNWRELIKFDLSQIPSGSTILTSNLYLYAMPVPKGGDQIHAHSGTANACYIQRITTPIGPFPAMTWSNQPSATTTNEAILPQTVTAFDNANVDVTNLVKDIQTNGNYGFRFIMQNETYYNVQQYASSYYPDASIHPKLVITYQ